MLKRLTLICILTAAFVIVFTGCQQSPVSNSPAEQPETSGTPSAPSLPPYPTPSVDMPDEITTISDFLIINEFDPTEGNALLHLGMLRDDAWNVLMEYIGIDYVVGGNAFYSSIDEGYHNTHEFDGFAYDTDKNDLLYTVSVSLERFLPTSSLRFGDTFTCVIELYGSDFAEYAEDGSGFSKYEYAIGNHFFAVFFVDGTAYTWRVSSLSEQTMRDAIIDNIEPGD